MANEWRREKAVEMLLRMSVLPLVFHQGSEYMTKNQV